MITTLPSPSSSTLPKPFRSLAVDAVAAAPLLSAQAIQDFRLGLSAAALSALQARGDDVSATALRRRLQAYTAPNFNTAKSSNAPSNTVKRVARYA